MRTPEKEKKSVSIMFNLSTFLLVSTLKENQICISVEFANYKPAEFHTLTHKKTGDFVGLKSSLIHK